MAVRVVLAGWGDQEALAAEVEREAMADMEFQA